MLVLGIETSCDETAAAVVRDGREVLSNAIYSQIARHRPYGGVVPEIACRCHVEALPGVIADAMIEAEVGWEDIDRIAVTHGPGLASSLLVGVAAAKGLAMRMGRPLIPVNHLAGHVHSMFLGEDGPNPADHCPMILLLVSGGHSCLVHIPAPGQEHLLGQTVDDAAGEALDKGAKLLGLGYPGGPEIEQAARGGNPAAMSFPRGRIKPGSRQTGSFDPDFCFSFSGLKTALRYHLERHPEDTSAEGLPDVAASYQQAVVDALTNRLDTALQMFKPRAFGCVGGVAKNLVLRNRLDELARQYDVPLFLAPLAFCTDNAAMIAGRAGAEPALPAATDFEIEPNLPLGCR